MDADLLGLKSPLAPSKGAAKGPGKEESPSNPQPAAPLTAREEGEQDTAPQAEGGFGGGRCLDGSFPAPWGSLPRMADGEAGADCV